MGPKPKGPQTGELFRQPLVELINGNHPLAKLADLIDWTVFEREWAPLFPSGRGRPATPPRLVAGLLYLQHTFACSDEALIWTWVENPYWQHFCGETYFQHEPPIDPSSLSRWRKRIGEEGVEWLLTVTIEAARKAQVINASSVEKVIVDTTVMEKAVAYPTDSRLLERVAPEFASRVDSILARVRRLLDQKPKDKNKLYSLHAPEVECIAKGKARQPYEFGVKVTVATTHREGVVVGIRSLPGNPFDGHTLAEAVEQVTILTDQKPKAVFVDKGYQGAEVPGIKVWRSGMRRGVTRRLKHDIKRRSAVEPMIGHMKNEGLLRRNWLRGSLGDALHAVLCGAGHNLRMILRKLRLLCARIQALLTALSENQKNGNSHFAPLGFMP